MFLHVQLLEGENVTSTVKAGWNVRKLLSVPTFWEPLGKTILKETRKVGKRLFPGDLVG